MGFVANNHGRRGVWKTSEPSRGVLDHRAFACEGEELFWQQFARQGPEACAGTAGEDHGDKGHRGGIVPVLIEWVINTLFQCYYLPHEKYHHHPRSGDGGMGPRARRRTEQKRFACGWRNPSATDERKARVLARYACLPFEAALRSPR